MKEVFIFLLTLVFGIQSFATDFWVTTPKPSTKERLDEIAQKYRSQIKDGEFVSSFDQLLGHPVGSSQMAVILDLDSMARTASLNGLFKKASKYYFELQEKLKALPDVSGLEKIVLSTRVSLAHMGTMLKSPQTENLWKEAHAWAPDAVLSPEEFSPAVILQFSKVVSHIKKIPVQIKSSESASVFVDGQRMRSSIPGNPLLRTALLEPGRHQVSVLAPGSNWTIQNFEVKETQKPNERPIKMVVQPTPFAGGDCQSPQFIGRDLPPKTKLLVAFDDDCSRIYSDHKWYALDGSTLDSKNSKVAILSDDLKPDSRSTSSLQSEGPQTKKSFMSELTRSGWFWAGLGAAVVGALVISSSSQTTTVPSHTTQ